VSTFNISIFEFNGVVLLVLHCSSSKKLCKMNLCTHLSLGLIIRHFLLLIFVICTVSPVLPLTTSCFNSTLSPSKTLPLITYSHTSESVTASNKAESAQYWEYNDLLHGQEISNPPQAKLDIYLLCNHTKPVQFVSEINPVS